MQFEQSDKSRFARWAPLLPRLIVGYGFAVHALPSCPGGLIHLPAYCNQLAFLPPT
jgi:hypothetical protein